MDSCPLYASQLKLNLDDCEKCEDKDRCGIRLIVSRLNMLESKVRNLERKQLFSQDKR